MEIRWLGQSAFEIKTSTGTILCDPAGAIVSSGPGHDPNTVLVLSRKEARPSGITDSMAVFDRPGEYEVAGICVRGVGTPVSEKVAGRGLNTVFLVEAEGMTVCSLGLPGVLPDAQALQMIGPVDVVLVRTDGAGMTLEQRASAVRSLEPKVVVPNGFDGATGQSTLTKFLAQLGVKTFEAQPKLAVSKSSLGDAMKVVVLSAKA